MSESPEEAISDKISAINTQYEQLGVPGLAQAYEEFKKEVSVAEAAAYKGEAGQLVLQRIRDLEKLFAAVTGNDVKELSVFMKDSEALRRTAEFASINAEHIKFGDLGGALLQDEFVTAMQRYMNPDSAYEPTSGALLTPEQATETFNALDWKKVGRWFYTHSKTPIASHFLYGPLATQRRRAAPRTRNVDDTLHARDKATAQRVLAEEIHDDPEQSTSHMVRTVYGVLVSKSGGERVNLFRFFVNPDSFSQSVENLFYTSFLVRDGKVKVDVDELGSPYIEIPDEETDADSTERLLHHIATFDMETWKRLVARLDLTELYIPHRAVEEDTFSGTESS